MSFGYLPGQFHWLNILLQTLQIVGQMVNFCERTPINSTKIPKNVMIDQTHGSLQKLIAFYLFLDVAGNAVEECVTIAWSQVLYIKAQTIAQLLQEIVDKIGTIEMIDEPNNI